MFAAVPWCVHGGSCRASMFMFISCRMWDKPVGLYCLAMFSVAIRIHLFVVMEVGLCVHGGVSL